MSFLDLFGYPDFKMVILRIREVKTMEALLSSVRNLASGEVTCVDVSTLPSMKRKANISVKFIDQEFECPVRKENEYVWAQSRSDWDLLATEDISLLMALGKGAHYEYDLIPDRSVRLELSYMEW